MNVEPDVRSSTGRAPVSKTGGWGFKSLRTCCKSGWRVASWRVGELASSGFGAGWGWGQPETRNPNEVSAPIV